MHGVAGDIEVYVVLVQKGSVHGRAIGKNATANGIGAGQYYQLGRRGGGKGNIQRLGHVFRNGSGNHNTIGMAWGGHKLNTKTPHVELHVTGSIHLPFTTAIATGRNLPQLERAAEEAVNLLTHQGRIHHNGLVDALLYNQVGAVVGGEFIVGGELHLAGESAGALAAEYAPTHVDAHRIGGNGLGGTERHQRVHIHTFGANYGSTPKYTGNISRGNIGNKLLTLVV